jgi:hypothetical protein
MLKVVGQRERAVIGVDGGHVTAGVNIRVTVVINKLEVILKCKRAHFCDLERSRTSCPSRKAA